MKIYTRRGDDGTTGLFAGPRVRKDDVRIEACGAVDELGAALGAARSVGLPADIDTVLAQVQHRLFDLGAVLAAPDPTQAGARVQTDHVGELERWIDAFSEELPPLRQFILAGGTPSAAALHLARAVCRRAERWVVALSGEAKLTGPAVAYLNRLGDLLFTLARLANHRAGVADVLWQPDSPPSGPS